jgi:hypothetical protein
MHHRRLVQLDAAGVLHDDRHAQPHQCTSQFGVLVLGIAQIANGGAFGALQLVADVVDGTPLVLGVFNPRFYLRQCF